MTGCIFPTRSESSGAHGGPRAAYRAWLLAGTALALLAASASALACAALPIAPFIAEYELYRNGEPVGSTLMRLQRRPDGTFDYRLESEANRGLLSMLGASFFEHSHWSMGKNGPRPLDFERGQSVAFSNRYYETHFDWGAGRAKGTARGDPWNVESLPTGALDRLLVNLALLRDLRCEAPTLDYTILERGKTETWKFERKGEETVTVPGGTYRAVKVARLHDRPDRVSVSWHAPALNWMAVRIEHQDDAEDDRFAMKLKHFSPLVDAPAVSGEEGASR